MQTRLYFTTLVALAALALSTLSSGAVDIVAHRGASADAPENTLPAFQLAWERGADRVEGDFYLTSDNVIVCFHDKTTKRIGGGDLKVSSTPYKMLQTLDVGAWKDPKWKGTRIPTLAEVLATLPADKGRIFIEIKDGVRIVKPLAEQLNKIDIPKSRLAFICFDQKVTAACKKAMPKVDAHWVVSQKSYQKMGIAGVIKTAKRLGADGIDVQASHAITPEFGKALRENGLQYHCWTVNDISLARYMVKLGVDTITTDRPEFIRRGLQTAKETAKVDARILQHLDFDDNKNGPVGIKGRGLSDTVLKTGKTLPASGTVAMWYRPSQWYDYQTVFDSSADPDVWELWINKDAQIGFRTTKQDLRITHRLHPVATLNQWQHIAVTWDKRAVNLYVNAAPVVSAKRKLPLPPAGDFCLGGGHADNNRGKGAWDEVVVFGAVLSASELRGLMLDGVTNAHSE
ncbi:MAG: glycerophosphodiester phosphodiesterase family protein [Akkermansiaceae bacterium]|nr:glycerophosphodiester phosphodiesterase family protein [Akkermansiaceae bacterium]